MASNVLRPSIQKLLQRALSLNAATQFLIFVPEFRCSLSDPGDATLRGGRASNVASRLLQEVSSVVKGLNLDSPGRRSCSPSMASASFLLMVMMKVLEYGCAAALIHARSEER